MPTVNFNKYLNLFSQNKLSSHNSRFININIKRKYFLNNKTVVENILSCKNKISAMLKFAILFVTLSNIFPITHCQVKSLNDHYTLNSHNLKHLGEKNKLSASNNKIAEFEKIKHDVLIDAFKIKLLKLLEVDEVPQVSKINNINNKPLPEPIIKEYNRMIKLNQIEKNRRRYGGVSSYGFGSISNSSSPLSRLSRQMPFDNQKHNEIDEEDENIRFNGSIVQHVTLLPKKIKYSETEDKSIEWCNSDHFVQKLDKNLKNNKEVNQNIFKEKNQETNDNHRNLNDQGFTLLNCFSFSLSQNEFKQKDIRSADLFMKLNFNELKNSFFENKQNDEIEKLIMKLEENGNIDNDDDDDKIDTNLYIQVNDKLVKTINLFRNQIGSSNSNENNNEGINDESSSLLKIYLNENNFNQDNSYIERIELKDLIDEEIYNSELLFQQTKNDVFSSFLAMPPTIRVRLFCRTDVIDLATQDGSNKFKNYFNKLNENAALRVTFGDHKPLSEQQANGLQNIGNNNGISKRTKRQHQHQHNAAIAAARKSAKAKNYRDCADLRKAGFSPSNYTCCRETISFSIEQIGWSHWILSPKIIEYKYCRGGCLSGLSPRFDNTQIVYTMFELSHQFESSHCCNIYDYEDDIPFIYGSPPNYLTKMVSLNAKNCLCS